MISSINIYIYINIYSINKRDECIFDDYKYNSRCDISITFEAVKTTFQATDQLFVLDCSPEVMAFKCVESNLLSLLLIRLGTN